MSDGALIQRAYEMTELAKRHVEVRNALAGVVGRHGYSSLGELAEKDPGLFDLIEEALKNMVTELPWTKGYGQ